MCLLCVARDLGVCSTVQAPSFVRNDRRQLRRGGNYASVVVVRGLAGAGPAAVRLDDGLIVAGGAFIKCADTGTGRAGHVATGGPVRCSPRREVPEVPR